MRTPLNTAHLGLKLLLDYFNGIGDSGNLETAKDIRESCDKAIAILNEVLVYDKLATGLLVIEPEYVSPYTFIAEVLRPFHLQVTDVVHSVIDIFKILSDYSPGDCCGNFITFRKHETRRREVVVVALLYLWR